MPLVRDFYLALSLVENLHYLEDPKKKKKQVNTIHTPDHLLTHS